MKLGKQGDGGGRPAVELSPDQIVQLESLASVLTKGQIADYFGMSETTLRAVEVRQPEVSDAYKKGRSRAIASVAGNLVNLARSGNVTAAIFYLKTQAGWREQELVNQEIPVFNITVDGRATNSPSE